jgi:hypothetical protein
MASDEEVVGHLLACFDAVYQSLGEAAPRLSNDSYVVKVYEMSRAFGQVALEMRTYLGDETIAGLPIIRAVLDHAVANDETAAMTLYAMAMVVGPRLLISLRDAREHLGADSPAAGILDHASQVVVAEIISVGEVAKGQAPIEDPSWQEAARDLTNTLESSGNGESFGFSR